MGKLLLLLTQFMKIYGGEILTMEEKDPGEKFV